MGNPYQAGNSRAGTETEREDASNSDATGRTLRIKKGRECGRNGHIVH